MFFKNRDFSHLLENGEPSPYSPKPPKKGGLFWSLLAPLLGTEPPAEPVDWRIEAMRRREARIRELNSPRPPMPSPVDAIPEPAIILAPVQRARLWLLEQLADGPVRKVEIDERAKAAGITPRTLGQGWVSNCR